MELRECCTLCKGETAFSLPLVGQFNLSNMLAAVGAVLGLGLDLSAIVEKLSQFSGVPGRMERVQISPDQDISVIVDYAHTPDSLENLLKASAVFFSGSDDLRVWLRRRSRSH